MAMIQVGLRRGLRAALGEGFSIDGSDGMPGFPGAGVRFPSHFDGNLMAFGGVSFSLFSQRLPQLVPGTMDVRLHGSKGEVESRRNFLV